MSLTEFMLAKLEGEVDQVSVSVSDTDLVLYFPYHKEAIARLKQIEGAEYQASDKCWSLPVTPENSSALYDTVMELRELFRREQDKAEARVVYQEQIAADVLAQLEADFEHAQLSFSVQGGEIGIHLPYDPALIRQLKKVDGRRWDSSEKCWWLPADQERQIRSVLRAVLKQLNKSR